MTQQDYRQGLLHRVGAASEPRKILDVNSADFDDIVKHFGQRIFTLGVVSKVSQSPLLPGHVATPVRNNGIPHPSASATELIARQQAFTGKIPALAKGVIIAWALFNMTWIILSLLRIL